MPIFMDLHEVPGVNAKDVAQAHNMDVLMEHEHSCKCLTYWVDEMRGYVFCLIDAPSKESVINLHSKAHGLVPHKIIEVEHTLVQAFLGRITDPENALLTENGLKIVDDTSFRIIMHIQIEELSLRERNQKIEFDNKAYQSIMTDAKAHVVRHNGRIVSGEANEMLASFVLGEQAFQASMAIVAGLDDTKSADVRISLHAGLPVTQSDKLFGDTVQLLKRLNRMNRDTPVLITAGLKELLPEPLWASLPPTVRSFAPGDETFINDLFGILESHHHDEHFDIEKCCRMLALSQSQLYRKTTQLLQFSPNNVLKNYRLSRAKDYLRTTNKPVSQISFETGFTSASYFTKCFKAAFGLLPLHYQELSHNGLNE